MHQPTSRFHRPAPLAAPAPQRRRRRRLSTFVRGAAFTRGPGWPHPSSIAAAAAGGIALLAAIGISVVSDVAGNRWHLDNEFTVPALFSAALLLGGGVCAGLAANRTLVGLRLPWVALAALLLGMSTDEVAQAHEYLEKWSGVDWQVLYAPLTMAAGVAWLVIVARLRGAARLMMAAGATAWVVSQMLEFLQWDGDRHTSSYEPMMVAEESLEMAGSALFLVALYMLLRRAANRTLSADSETLAPLDTPKRVRIFERGQRHNTDDDRGDRAGSDA